MKHLFLSLTLASIVSLPISANNTHQSPTTVSTPTQEDDAFDVEAIQNATSYIKVEIPKGFMGKELPARNTRKVKLAVLSTKANDITDDDNWLGKYGNEMPYRRAWFGDMPSDGSFNEFLSVPLTYEDLYRGDMEKHADYWVVGYGLKKFEHDWGYDCNLLVVTDPGLGKVRYVFDFRALTNAFCQMTDNTPGNEVSSWWTSPTFYGLTFDEKEPIAYVAMAHNTYASSSHGKNAYLLAIDIKTGQIKWMTKPLTCNSEFIITGNSIICGYGFTNEKHYVYVVDKQTGRRAQQILIAKSPSYFSLKGNRLYMRTYSFDYVLSVTK